MYLVGFDVGGSNLKAAITDEKGNTLAKEKCKIADILSHNLFLEQLVEMVANLCAELNITAADLNSIGLAVPGAVDIHSGSILYCCNLPIRNVPVRRYLHKYFDIPVLLENDANCAALAEYLVGSGIGSKRFITITLGTGVGGGIIHNGKIFHGSNGMAGEVGHMTIVQNGLECTCGNRGCWEQYSSSVALKRMTKVAMVKYPDSILCKVIDENNGHISGQSAFMAARRGDLIGKMVCDEYLDYLTTGIVNLINIFQPDALAIGGGISNENDEQLLIPLRKRVYARLMPVNIERTKIVKATLGNDAGVVGAALLGMKKRV